MDGLRYSTLDARVRAVEAVRKGMPVLRTAMAIRVDRTTLHLWLTRYDQDGAAGCNGGLSAVGQKNCPS